MSVDDVQEVPARYGEVFAEPRFRVIFAARTLSIAAETLRIFALSVLVFSVSGSPLLGALAFGIGFLPQVVGGTLLGALADRVPQRRLITGGYLLEAVVAAVLALLRLPVGWSLVLVGGVACFTPVFNGAAARLVAEVLTGDRYVLGRAVSSMASSGAQLLGLAGGGLAVAALGARRALLVSAVAHLLAAALVRLRLPEFPVVAGAPDRPSALRQSWTGTGRLLADPLIRRLMLAQWVPPMFLTGAEGLIVPFAQQRNFAPGSAGLLLAALPAGMLLGDFVVGRFIRPLWRERLVVPLIALLGAPVAVLVTGPPLAVAVPLLGLAGAGFAYQLGLQRVFLNAVPELARGQAFALLGTGMMTFQGLGPLIAGAAAQLSSPATVIAVCGLVIIPSAVLARRSRRTA
jgi:predicted MFS family arabinose efflux permease